VKFRSRRCTPVEANFTPLIDVVFLLLIFFMVSTTFTDEKQMRINLPEAQAEASQSEDRQINLMIMQDGAYSINGRAVASPDIGTLMEALSLEAGDNLEQAVVISADSETTHQSVVRAMDAAGRLGLTQIRITSQVPLAGP
jgi:biopolymer transport protein ExbD|tara:strand:+ start:15769 stop:16191 length:423 start_codon:yes stop_codon:yes gene_type:complete